VRPESVHADQVPAMFTQLPHLFGQAKGSSRPPSCGHRAYRCNNCGGIVCRQMLAVHWRCARQVLDR